MADADDAWFRAYWARNAHGPRIYKWDHYFAIYKRHLYHFRNTSVRVAEVGVNDGGSLLMWRAFFGDDATLFGIDLNNRTLGYARRREYGHPTEIVIEDQRAPGAWERICERLGPLDVVLDDASHDPRAQVATVTGAWSCLRPGGVIVVEDVFRTPATGAVSHLVREHLRGASGLFATADVPNGELVSTRSQAAVFGVHFYALVVVLEKLSTRRRRLSSISTGTMTMPNPPVGFNVWGRPCTANDELRGQCNLDDRRRMPSTVGR